MRALHTFGWLAWAGLACTALAAPGVLAKDEPRFDFENDTQGWVSAQATAVVRTTQEPGSFKSGKAALEWSYDPSSQDALLIRQAPELKEGPTAVEFWIRSSANSSFQLFLSEGDGSRYHLMLRLNADEWTHVQALLSDLTLSSTQDENSQLDLDQVNTIAIMDSSRFSAGDQLAVRKLWLDGATFSTVTVPQRRLTRAVDGKQEVVFDDFDAEFVGWEAGGMQSLALKREEKRTWLQSRFQCGEAGKRPFGLGDHLDGRYSQMKAIRLVARADRPLRLWLQLREWDGTFEGPTYRAFVELPAGKEWQTRVVGIKEFQLLPGMTDPNNQLDVGTVWLFNVGEATQVDAAADATLEIDCIGAVISD